MTWRLLMLGILWLHLQGCTPAPVVKQYEPVEIVREVAKPIPERYTAPLTGPAWPDHSPLTGQDMANMAEAWKVFLRCIVNPHRAHVKALSDGKGDKPVEPEGCE